MWHGLYVVWSDYAEGVGHKRCGLMWLWGKE